MGASPTENNHFFHETSVNRSIINISPPFLSFFCIFLHVFSTMICLISVILISLRELSRKIMIMDGSLKMGSENADKPMDSEPSFRPTEWSHGIQIIYRSDHLNRYIPMPPSLLVLWTVFQALVFVLPLPPWLGHSLGTETIAMVLWFWGSLYFGGVTI